MGISRSSTAAVIDVGVDVGRGAGRWPAAVQDDDVDAAEGIERRRDEPLEVGGDGEIARKPRTAPILAASRSTTSALRANIATLAPSAASASETASPIPCEAPSTTALRP